MPHDSSADLIKEIWMTIVHAGAERLVEHPLAKSHKAELLQCHVVGKRTDAACEDVLSEPNNCRLRVLFILWQRESEVRYCV